MSQVDRLERYRAQDTPGLAHVVEVREPGSVDWLASCARIADAEKIARALNDAEGAVDALYEIATQPFADGTTPRQKAQSALLAMGLDWRTTTSGGRSE